MTRPATPVFRQLRTFVALLLLAQSPSLVTHGFQVGFRPSLATLHRSGSPLMMAKARRTKQKGGNPNSLSGKKGKKPPKGKNLENTNNIPRAKKKDAGTTNGVVLPSRKSHAPPWQVLSNKEAKQNVVREKTRRELARQGIDMDDDEQYQSKQQKKSLSESLLSDADRQLVNWKRFNPSSVPCGMTFMGAFLGKQLPPRLGVPEVAFLGRSNVGKSSLLNKLSSSALGGGGSDTAADEARVGKTPGATASVNLYAMLGRAKQQKAGGEKVVLGLADLPGFGYAKLSKETQASIQEAAERYLDKRQELALGLLLVDARRIPSDDDRAVLAALYDLGLPIVVVTTKIDKLKKSEVEPAMEAIRDALGLPNGQPLCVSSVTGEGTKQLWKIIMEACEDKVEELKGKLVRQRTSDEESAEYDGGMIPTELDEFGNAVLPYDDGEALAYEQGYDWIQDSAVMYEYDEIVTDDEIEQLEDEDDSSDEAGNEPLEESFKLKDLKRRVRKMERGGTII